LDANRLGELAGDRLDGGESFSHLRDLDFVSGLVFAKLRFSLDPAA
jgi:hypothetical protein